MISDTLDKFLRRHCIHYGWVVAGITFLTMLVTAGALGAPGILIVPLEKEFGWDTAEISSALALRLVLFGLIAPFAAAFLNRFGVRRMVMIALGAMVVGLAMSLFMKSVWQLVALWGVLIGVASGLTALVLGATIATRWFSERRGLVTGIVRGLWKIYLIAELGREGMGLPTQVPLIGVAERRRSDVVPSGSKGA